MSDINSRPTARRTMYPRTHVRETPLTPDELTRAREVEKARAQHDPSYITAEAARAIPTEELRRNPELAGRVRYSQEDWPENRMSATEALGALDGGGGEVTEQRQIPAESIFTGGPMGSSDKEG